MNRCLGFLALWYLSLSVQAQENTLADSLQLLLAQTQTDTHRVNLLNDLAWELMFDYPDQARTHLQSSLQLAQSIPYLKGAAQAYNNRGVVEDIEGNVDSAAHYFQEALLIRDSLGDLKGVASIYNNNGKLMESKGESRLALENHRKSLYLREELRDTQRMARVNYNIGRVYESIGDYPEALDHVFRYLELSQGMDDDQESAFNAHSLIGNIKAELERFQEAEEHYLIALGIAQQRQDASQLSLIYNNLGNIKDDLGERSYKDEHFDEALPLLQAALDYHHQSLAIRIQNEDSSGEGASYNNLGVVHK
ncbi:MAG: tetratricopeptide repeat protein, partial [Bacteroidota bacterium]